ncbi:MAG: DNA polymerase III subunit delta' [Candidatus Nitrospinota bacterium M3_3B_026]
MGGQAPALGGIIGQPTALRILRAGLPPGEPAHAYLFMGSEGVGKFTAAFAFARALLCEKRGEDACGVCGTCVKTASGAHPDIIVVRPEIREKKVKEEIDIARAREIIRAAGYRPYEARRKVLVIDGADRMNTAAQNAFLKTLEEPPGDTVIILAAVNTGKLLPTIISRCRMVRFNPVPFGALAAFLEERGGMTDEEARAAAALSRGSPGLALSGALDEEKEIREEAISILFGKDGGLRPEDILKLAVFMDKGADRSRVDRLLQVMTELVRDLLTMRIRGKCDNLINVDIASRIEKAASGMSRRRLLRIYSVTQEMIFARQWNVNPLLVTGLLCLESQE